MAKNRAEFEWEQTSSLMALIVNLVRNPKKSKVAKPNDFNPYKVKVKPRVQVPLSFLKEVWCKK